MNPARTLAEAAAIPATAAPAIVLGATLADGPAAPLLARWRDDPAFRDAQIVLVGPWPPESAAVGPGCHAEILRGQRAADAVGRVRALLARRPVTKPSAGDG